MANEFSKAHLTTIQGVNVTVALPEAGGYEVSINGSVLGGSFDKTLATNIYLDALVNMGVFGPEIAELDEFLNWPLELIDRFDPEVDK